MNATSVERIRRSYERLAPKMRDLTGSFYERLFVASPEVRSLFPPDLAAQRNHLAAALAVIVRNLAVLDALEEPLRALGAAHARLGVIPGHYPTVCDAMIGSLAAALDSHWNDELAGDWRELLLTISRHMLAGSLDGES